MKILEFNEKKGELTLKIDNLNDLWTLYNLISKDDHVAMRTQRRVVLKEGSKGERKPMFLKLKVEDLAFHEFSNRLRIKGTILEGPEDFVSFGTYHTFNVEIGDILLIIKENWLKSELKRLKESTQFDSNFVIFFIAIERGLATLEISTNFSHNRITSIKKHIPGKRYEQSHRNKAYLEFFDDIKKVLEENLNKFDINLIIVCGPGNIRKQFINYIREKYDPPYLSKFKTISASSGTESAILEALKSQELVKLKKKIRILHETEKVERILEIFSTDADLIKIGFNEVSDAAEIGAIKELFLTDKLIRGTSTKNKILIEKILTDVEASGGTINILNSKQPPGQQVEDLGSLIGILRYKL